MSQCCFAMNIQKKCTMFSKNPCQTWSFQTILCTCTVVSSKNWKNTRWEILSLLPSEFCWIFEKQNLLCCVSVYIAVVILTWTHAGCWFRRQVVKIGWPSLNNPFLLLFFLKTAGENPRGMTLHPKRNSETKTMNPLYCLREFRLALPAGNSKIGDMRFWSLFRNFSSVVDNLRKNDTEKNTFYWKLVWLGIFWTWVWLG